jgi:adenine-specific DNA methylase
LEPSAGDGAFIRGLAKHEIASRVSNITAVEINPEEAAKCDQELRKAKFPGKVVASSILNGERYRLAVHDAAVGNPPFVRFQFLSAADREGALDVAAEVGLTLTGVSNLWLPIFLTALSRLRPDGAFAFIVPAECLTGISARSIRSWLIQATDELRLDLFPPGSFPTVLQEVLVVSGKMRRISNPGPTSSTLSVLEHLGNGPVGWQHEIEESSPTWTRYLLSPSQLGALRQVAEHPEFRQISEVARLTVSTVTGANEYFSVNDSLVEKHRLDVWRLPLLPRIRYATGLIFGEQDHEDLRKLDCARWLLDFSASLPDPELNPSAYEYLLIGKSLKLHQRYKCRIRTPWYRVPVVSPGRLLLSKRSHKYPRLILNDARVTTTDTIYQGDMVPAFSGKEGDFVAGFHNTVTLLTAEIEGRSFGGGVLELVPSEIGRLHVPIVSGLANYLPILDQTVRDEGADSESLIEKTDNLIIGHISGISGSTLDTLRDARMELLRRRMDRTL